MWYDTVYNNQISNILASFWEWLFLQMYFFAQLISIESLNYLTFLFWNLLLQQKSTVVNKILIIFLILVLQIYKIIKLCVLMKLFSLNNITWGGKIITLHLVIEETNLVDRNCFEMLSWYIDHLLLAASNNRNSYFNSMNVCSFV